MAKKGNSNKPELTEAQKLQVKKANFARVLPSRMDKALKAIRMVGDCTNPSYSYTKEDAKAVTDKLLEAVTEVEKRFSGVQGKSGGFELP